MHVLCAPPAFILSQDQTLLFLVSISCLSTSTNLFYKCLNLTYFFGRLLYRFFTGLSQRFIVYFSMYFLRSTLCRTTLILPSVLGFVNTFFKLFYFIFLCFLPLQKGIKKLVIFPSASHIFLLKYITNPSFFICFSFGLLGTFLYYHFSSFMSILFFNFF